MNFLRLPDMTVNYPNFAVNNNSMGRSITDEYKINYNQKYYQRHRDKLLQRQKEYYYANREERLQYQKKYQRELYASMTPEEKKAFNKIKNYKLLLKKK